MKDMLQIATSSAGWSALEILSLGNWNLDSRRRTSYSCNSPSVLRKSQHILLFPLRICNEQRDGVGVGLKVGKGFRVGKEWDDAEERMLCGREAPDRGETLRRNISRFRDYHFEPRTRIQFYSWRKRIVPWWSDYEFFRAILVVIISEKSSYMSLHELAPLKSALLQKKAGSPQ